MRAAARFLAVLVAALTMAAAPAIPPYPSVRPGTPIRFPTDHGAHPRFRTEWWYVTGWLRTADRRDLGFQVTFFRSRPPADSDNPSAFAPRQILFAHAALSDPAVGRLLHDQRIARQGFGLAQASTADTDIVDFELHELLLQRTAPRGRRQDHASGPRRRSHGRGVAGPRMVFEPARSCRRGLGLGRPQP